MGEREAAGDEVGEQAADVGPGEPADVAAALGAAVRASARGAGGGAGCRRSR